MNLTDLIKRFGNGSVAEELDAMIKEAVKKSILRDGKSTVTLKLDFTPNEQSGVIIGHKLALSTPSITHARTFLFVDDDGELSATDPDQARMKELRSDFAHAGSGKDGGDE